MAPTRYGLDFTQLRNITKLNVTLPQNVNEWVEQIPQKANELTSNQVGFGMMSLIFLASYNALADTTPLTSFGYSDLKSVTISFGIAALIGLTLMQIGYIFKIQSVGIFLILFGLFWVIDYFVENKG